MAIPQLVFILTMLLAVLQAFGHNQLSNVPSAILNNIFSANVTYSPYGNVSLPEASITGDPLFCSVFELNNNSSRLMTLSRQVYLASEAYYNATRQYAAFSEGNSPYTDLHMTNGLFCLMVIHGK